MPSRNVVKQFVEGGVYHAYNRGVEKRIIFEEPIDYKVFMHYLKEYLLPEGDPMKKAEFGQGRTLTRVRRSFDGRIKLLAFCLMPNHFHLLLKQTGENDLSEFMKCLATSYSIYFNRKNKRVGSLFQGTYRAILIKDDDYLLHLSRYIHLNPSEFIKPKDYDFSSYQNYLGTKNTKWVNPKFILDYWEDNKGNEIINLEKYQDFVEEYDLDPREFLGEMTLE